MVEGWLGRGTTTLHCTHMHCHIITDTRASFLSLPPWPCGWRDALCNQVSCRGHGWQAILPRRPGVLCEGDEGTAEVRDQRRFPPSASAARESSGNCRGRSSRLYEIMQIVTSAVRLIYLACVCSVEGHCTGERCILASL